MAVSVGEMGSDACIPTVESAQDEPHSSRAYQLVHVDGDQQTEMQILEFAQR